MGTDARGADVARRAVYECAGFSAQGLGRRINQDRYRISDAGVVVCDGIGGEEAGEVYAEASCWSCERLLKRELDAGQVIEVTNGTIAAVRDALGGRGGTSACVVRFLGDSNLETSSRGDVLAFLVDGTRVRSVNAPDYVRDWRLSAYVGDRRTSGRDVTLLPALGAEELLVLLTDGVWKHLSADEVASVCGGATDDIAVMAEGLVRLAGRYGSLDDRTAVVCRRST